MPHENPQSLTRLEKFISLFCPLQPHDGRKTCVIGMSGFFLMFAYYLVRPVREALLLSQSSAEIRTYAVGSIAVLVLMLVPAYNRWLRHRTVHQVFQRVLLANVALLVGFAACGLFGLPLGIPFFIWLGIFSLFIVAQYWTVAASIFGVESGQRILPAIAIGLSIGALVGSRVVGYLYPALGPYGLMVLAAGVFLLHLNVQEWIIRNICPQKSGLDFVPKYRERDRNSFGFRLVLRNSYLLKIAIFVTLLNWIDTAGDFILAQKIREYVTAAGHAGDAVAMGAHIGSIYAELFFWICVLGLLFQLVAVSRIFRRGGIGIALLVLPLVLTIGYTLFGIIPIFTTIFLLKVFEASVDYSIQGTAKHALFLPLNPVITCHAKMTIDTFFWRFGDLIQALVIFVGLRFLDFDTIHFVGINLVLATLCITLAISLGREYGVLADCDSKKEVRTRSRRAPKLRWSHFTKGRPTLAIKEES